MLEKDRLLILPWSSTAGLPLDDVTGVAWRGASTTLIQAFCLASPAGFRKAGGAAGPFVYLSSLMLRCS